MQVAPFDAPGADPLLPALDELRNAVDVAAGRRPADLLLLGGRLLNVFDGRVATVDVAVAGRLVAAVLPAGTVRLNSCSRGSRPL